MGWSDAFREDPPGGREVQGKDEAHDLSLFEFHQRSTKVLRMQEQHRLAMCADLGFAVTEHARAVFNHPVAGGLDVRHFVAQVVNAVIGIVFEEGGDRRLVS